MSRSRDLAAVRTQPATTTLGTSNYRAGVNAGNSIASGGNFNVTLGDEAGTAISTGDENVAVGYNALAATNTGGNNIAIGKDALLANTTGNTNIAIGTDAMTTNVAGDRNVAVGEQALQNMNPSGNVDTYNIGVGYNAGLSVTTGVQNTFVGGLAGDATDDGTNNVAVGFEALSANCGSGNTAIGCRAGKVTTADDNTFVGNNAGTATTSGNENTFLGNKAGEDVTTGADNTFVGSEAGDGTDDGANNVAVGKSSLSANCGDNNTAVGLEALKDVTGSTNTALGKNAGNAITSGSNNMCLGVDAGKTGSPGGNLTTSSDSIRVGDENVTNCHIQVDWTVASDQRDKTDFTALDLGLDFVKALAPVTYKWDKRSKYGDKNAEDYDITNYTPDGTHKEDWLDIGFKAQEVQALEEAAGYTTAAKKNLTVSTSSDGKQMGLQYSKFVPILVKAMQEQNALIEALTARIATLEG